MTNNNDPLTQRLLPLSSQSAMHVRIHTAVMDGKVDLAKDLLTIRMEGALQGYAEGDIIEDPALLEVLAVLRNMPGPLARMVIRTAADAYIDDLL